MFFAFTLCIAVVYIDQCEEFFGKKSKDKEGPIRLKKDFLTYKNKAINNDHRVIIMGTTRFPENGDPKDLRAFFDKFLYFPYPDYPTRVLVWKHFIAEQIRDSLGRPQDKTNFLEASSAMKSAADVDDAVRLKIQAIIDAVDISSLAFVSEGYSVGAIAHTVQTVVTSRRVATINTRPLRSEDFADLLALHECTFENDKETYMQFGQYISSMEQKKGGGKKKGGKKKKK